MMNPRLHEQSIRTTEYTEQPGTLTILRFNYQLIWSYIEFQGQHEIKMDPIYFINALLSKVCVKIFECF